MSESSKQKAYRQSDAGRLARKMRSMNPEVRMKRAIRRKVKKHFSGK